MPSQSEEVAGIIEGGPNPGSGDKATQMLSELFGDEWWEILWSGQEIQGEPSLIMPILQAFNVLMLCAVCLILLYVVGHAFVGSAHEGTPLGRRLHSVWVPVRSVLSISLLAPIPWAQVLNFIQGVVLCFVGFSIQFANTAMTAGVDYMAQNQGQTAVSVPINLADTGSEIAEAALHNYMIQYHQYWFQENDSLVLGYDKDTTKSLTQKTKNFFGMKSYSEVVYTFRNPRPYSADAMGSITVKCKEVDSSLCQARQNTTENLLADAEDVANRKIRHLYGDSVSPPSENEVVGMIERYSASLDSAIRQLMTTENPELEQELARFTETIKEQGFVMLGSYFWTMSRFSTALQDQANAETRVKDYNDTLLRAQTVSQFNQIKTNLSSMDSFFRRAEHYRQIAELGTGRITEKGDSKGMWKFLWKKLSEPFQKMTDGFIGAISSGDPISRLSSWGHWITSIAVGLFAGLLAGSFIPGIDASSLMPIIIFVVAPMFLLGFTLAYYLPAVPFIIWIMAVFGWLLMVLEALVAAPIWAAMHASPDGEGIAGEKGAQGYTIFMQILLRPILMVIGFFFAMLMMHVVSYAGELFSVYFHGATGNETFSGPISAAAGMFLGSVILIILTHKSFSLIHYLPEMVTRWIGAGGGSMGEQSELAESKRTIVGGVASHTPRTAGHGRSASIVGGAVAGGAMAATAAESGGSGDQESQSEDHQPGESGEPGDGTSM